MDLIFTMCYLNMFPTGVTFKGTHTHKENFPNTEIEKLGLKLF